MALAEALQRAEASTGAAQEIHRKTCAKLENQITILKSKIAASEANQNQQSVIQALKGTNNRKKHRHPHRRGQGSQPAPIVATDPPAPSDTPIGAKPAHGGPLHAPDGSTPQPASPQPLPRPALPLQPPAPSHQSRKRAHSVIPASDDDDDDDEEPISMLERRQQPRRNKAPSVSATTVYSGAIMCDHPDQHRTQIECVTAAMEDIRMKYTTFYNSFCRVTHEDRCVTLFPLVYWWAPLIPLLQRFDTQLQQGSEKRYWGRHAFGCKHHKKDMWEVPLLFPWADGELEDWLERRVQLSHRCGN